MMETGRDPYVGILDVVRTEAQELSPLYFCIGTVLSVDKEKILVQADGHELDNDDLLINDQLRDTWMEDEWMDIEMGGSWAPEMELSGRLNGSASPCANGSHSYFNVTDTSGGRLRQEKASVVPPWRLAKGDKVLLIPNESRQLYYLVMKVVAYGTVPPDRAS